MNLGRTFDFAQEEWPHLCSRIDEILSGQIPLLPAPEHIEKLAQRYAARLVMHQPEEQGERGGLTSYQEVDVESLELVQPRSVGVEHVGMSALQELGMPEILTAVGLNGVQQAVALGCIIGRMAAPGSERETYDWLTGYSGLGELLEVDYEAMPLMRLYRTSDLLVKHRQAIESASFARINNLFCLPTTVTLYDLTNTYYEGDIEGSGKAKRGHSKEKRSDCPLVTLGLVLDGNGFARRSKMFAGSVAESSTLKEMLEDLAVPTGAMVIMDRGIATEANIAWLVAHHYRYLVVSREKNRQFDADQAVAVSTASNTTVSIQRVLSNEGTEVRLYFHSEERQQKEEAITNRFMEIFEAGLAKLAAGLKKPHGQKKRDKLLQRIGRLQEKSHGIGRHYRIDLIPDATGDTAIGLTWEKLPVTGTQMTHPGVYCLRTNELTWDEATLWQTYTKAEPKLQRFYDALGIAASPGGTKKRVN